jgi:hypothetical protein
MSRRIFSAIGGSLSLIVGLIACDGIVGVTEIDVASDDGGGDSSPALDSGSSSDGNVGADGRANVDAGTDAGHDAGHDAALDANDAGTTAPSLGGNLHFLQTGGSLVLANGTDKVTVTASGKFTFPTLLAKSATYHVTVDTNPAGQKCWVQQGDGTAGTTDVTDVDVRCSVIKEGISSGTAAVSVSPATFTAIPNVDTITFDNDLAADVMFTLVVPNGAAAPFPTTYSIAFQLDGGTPFGAVPYATYQESIPFSAFTYALANVPAGHHTVTAVWSLQAAAPMNAVINSDQSVAPTRATVIVLDSLPSFDKVLTSSMASLTGQLTVKNTPTALGITPIGFNLSVDQLALVTLSAPDMMGNGTGVLTTIDGDPFGVQSMDHGFGTGVAHRSLTPQGFVSLAAGAHTIDSQWVWSHDGDIPQQGSTLPLTVSAVLWKNGVVHNETRSNTSASYTLPATYGTLSTLNLILPHASKVYVTFSSTMIRELHNWPEIADIAFFVNGTQAGPQIRQSQPNDLDWGNFGWAFAGVVDAPAGAVTIDLRAKIAPTSGTGGSPTIEFATYPSVPRTLFGALALE